MKLVIDVRSYNAILSDLSVMTLIAIYEIAVLLVLEFCHVRYELIYDCLIFKQNSNTEIQGMLTRL